MPSPSPPLEDQIRSLTLRLEAIESRLEALEGRAAPAEEAAPEPEPVPGAAVLPAEFVVEFDARRWTTALGRSLIVLGGAYLLRALTDAGIWPPVVGVSVGLAYALAWLSTSFRAAARSDRVRALFDGGTALVIGFPIIVEATLRFRLLPTEAAAAFMAAFSAIVLAGAHRVRLQALAWLAAAAGTATAVTLMVQTGAIAPYSFYFTGLGVAALWLGYTRQWKGLRWPTGLLAVVGVQIVALRALAKPPLDSAATAWLTEGLLLAAYFASIAIRTLVRGRQVIVFEVVQTLLVLLVAVGGALAVSRAVGTGSLVLGSALMSMGVIAYLVSFPFLPRESRGALNFYFYSTLAILFMLIGLRTALAGAPQAVALTALGAVLALAWARSGRVTLGGHAAVALVAAAVSGGLIALGLSAFVGMPPTVSIGAAGFTLAAALLISGCRTAGSRSARLAAAEVPALVIALLAVTGTAGAITIAAVAAIEALSGSATTPGALATVRTAVLSAGAVTCARLDRAGRFSALGKLSYPLLAATGVKLAVIDLRLSTPATAFIALACYGTALVLVPRLRRAGW